MCSSRQLTVRYARYIGKEQLVALHNKYTDCVEISFQNNYARFIPLFLSTRHHNYRSVIFVVAQSPDNVTDNTFEY